MKTICILAVLIAIEPTISKDIFEITTGLDDLRFRFLFHTFREFIFNTIGKTGQKTKGSFLQEKFPGNAQFPCDIRIGRSKSRPLSIHKLRVGGKKLLLHQLLFVRKKFSFTFCVEHNRLIVKLSSFSVVQPRFLLLLFLQTRSSRKREKNFQLFMCRSIAKTS